MPKLGLVLCLALAASLSFSTPDGKEQALIEHGVEASGDSRLDKEYREINALYFSNGLPIIPVLWEPALQDVGKSYGKNFVMQGLWGRVGGKACILLNPKLKEDPAALRGVLCHEMVHEYLNTLGDTSTSHGPAFQKVLRRLLDQGAFQGVASDGLDRERARTWLDAKEQELKRLDGEIAFRRLELNHLDGDMKDLNQRIQEANARGYGWPSKEESEAVESNEHRHVADFNALIRYYNDGVAQFNQEAAHYNQMMAYPDGLNEDALVPPKAPDPEHPGP